jgi:hypothetical protein
LATNYPHSPLIPRHVQSITSHFANPHAMQ